MNGYTPITINDKQVGIKFGKYANRAFSERKQNAKYFSGESLNEIGIAALLFSGYENQCVLEDKETELTLADFSDYVEESSMSGNTQDIEKAVKCWTESRLIKKAVDNLNDAKADLKKKKQTLTNSKK